MVLYGRRLMRDKIKNALMEHLFYANCDYCWNDSDDISDDQPCRKCNSRFILDETKLDPIIDSILGAGK